MNVYQYIWNCILKRETVHTILHKSTERGYKRIAWSKNSWYPKEKETADIIHGYESGLISYEQGFDTEIITPNPRLVIFGAGHISKVLSEMAYLAGFSVVVYDDRKEFITRERFPNAELRICADFMDIKEHLSPCSQDYYVILTHGHCFDEVCAREVLPLDGCYTGMIGSKAKVALVKEQLMASGITKRQLDSMYAPVGLPIGGKSPGDIAVSILAQMIQVKNQLPQNIFDSEIGTWIADSSHTGVMVTILKKEGSAPAAAGRRMFVKPDGSILGTIGGGNLELTAIKEAFEVMAICIKKYELTEQSGGLSMACNGTVQLVYEPFGKQ